MNNIGSNRHGLNSAQIKDLLDRILDPSKINFLGVFPKDIVPRITNDTRFPACPIVNSDPSSKPGTHWLAVLYTDESHCEFFDTFAFPPSFYGLSKLFRNIISPMFVDSPIQSSDSHLCGHYCIYFLFKRSCGLSMYSILRFF
jgi:hypothetical protein